MSEVRPPHDDPGHDAQRKLEHHALRNVRGLVDRIESDDQAQRATQKRILMGLVAAVAAIAILITIAVFSDQSGGEIVVPPPAKAPAR